MKHKKLLGALLLLLLPIFAWVGVASAQTTRTGNHATVAADEKVDSTLFTAANSIDIAGQVHGDVFCAGQNVTISGDVDGDVICAAQTIHISGKVSGDVRLAGQNVSVSGDVKGNATVAGQAFTLDSMGKIKGDLWAGANDVFLNGSVGRDMSAAGNQATLVGTVGRNLTANVNDLTVGNQAKIDGNIIYTSDNEAQIATGAEINGTTEHKEPTHKSKAASYNMFWGLGMAVAICLLLSALVTSLVLVLLFPKDFHVTTKWALDDPLKTLLFGLLASLVMPVAIVLLAITLVGIPLAIFVTLAWLLVLFLSGPLFSYYIGRLIWRKQHNPVLIMLLGAIVVLLLYLIPVVGVLTMMVAWWFGVGMIVRQLLRRTPRPKYDL